MCHFISVRFPLQLLQADGSRLLGLGQKGTVLQLYRVVVAVLMDILSQLAAI